ncbi:hypothetical protein M8C21_030556 [Ambrosia artemisiifolia]|uniref:Uncharacterized protein n=1 Tax=Ambrosia artemisiifolia TaxID=4212 RepID=A0AAD5CBN1_AMBAR|nr:hypothetical protein M8C21_030556 [Ambrosia artemisiifolia]
MLASDCVEGSSQDVEYAGSEFEEQVIRNFEAAARNMHYSRRRNNHRRLGVGSSQIHSSVPRVDASTRQEVYTSLEDFHSLGYASLQDNLAGSSSVSTSIDRTSPSAGSPIDNVTSQSLDNSRIYFVPSFINQEHSALSAGVAITAGPRRFLFRRTLGRFQTEEARIVKAANSVHDLTLSVQLMKKESEKLLERAALAEKGMTFGYSELRNTGGQFKSLAKTAHKVECQANDLVDDLREIPGREALRLRGEVANMASTLKDERLAINKRILKISELGVRL